jgi:chromosome segregation ATPase
MANKILKIALALSIGTFTLLQAKSEYERNYNNSTINVPSSKNDKIFIREYKYNASDTDSKVSSRKKAIAQLKSILSEEVGVHIQSSFDVKQTSHNKYVKKEINQLSASITKLKILEEKWNGVTYYIKASVKINEEQTMLLLLEAIKAKASQKDVNRLNKILKEQNGNLDKSYSKIQQLQKKLVLQEIKNQASKDELLETQKRLKKLENNIDKYNYEIKINKKQEKIYKTKLAKMKALIGDINNKAKYRLKKRQKENERKSKKWEEKKKLICSLEEGVYMSEVANMLELNLNRHPTIYLNNCETYGDGSMTCKYNGGTYTGYSKKGIKNKIIGESFPKVCSEYNSRLCVKFTFNSNMELSYMQGCKR